MIFLLRPIAYPASKAAFHCLYFSPNFIITMSDFFIHILLFIELIDANIKKGIFLQDDYMYHYVNRITASACDFVFPADPLSVLKFQELGYEAFYTVILGSDQGRELYKKKLIRLSEQYRMLKQIRFIDHCKNMALAYKVSDIIVSASNEPEAFGRVSVEAQSMGKPIVASNIGGSNETVIDEKTGFLFESNNAKSLSKQILRVLNMDETSLKMMSIEARKNVTQRFNVEKMCFSTYSEYKRLLN